MKKKTSFHIFNISRLRNILGNIQNNLKATPERSALVTMDVAVVSSMTMLGMISRAIMADVEPCTAIQLAGQELLTIKDLVDFSLGGNNPRNCKIWRSYF